MCIGIPHGLSLSLAPGRHHMAAISAICGDSGAANHGIDGIAIRKGVGEGAKKDNAGAFSADEAVGVCVKRFTGAIGRKHSAA